MFKKFATMLLALLLVTTAAPAESSVSDAAKALVPPAAALTESERDDGLWEYDFRDGDMRYEVVLDGQMPILLTTRNTAVKAAAANTLTAETAVSGITGEILYAQAEKDDGRWVWKIIVQEETDLVEYDLHAETGEIIEVERYFSATLALPSATYKRLDLELDDGRLEWDRD